MILVLFFPPKKWRRILEEVRLKNICKQKKSQHRFSKQIAKYSLAIVVAIVYYSLAIVYYYIVYYSLALVVAFPPATEGTGAMSREIRV
jgi:hypothetical protein